jgi:hypothetical protein
MERLTLPRCAIYPAVLQSGVREKHASLLRGAALLSPQIRMETVPKVPWEEASLLFVRQGSQKVERKASCWMSTSVDSACNTSLANTLMRNLRRNCAAMILCSYSNHCKLQRLPQKTSTELIF